MTTSIFDFAGKRSFVCSPDTKARLVLTLRLDHPSNQTVQIQSARENERAVVATANFFPPTSLTTLLLNGLEDAPRKRRHVGCHARGGE